MANPPELVVLCDDSRPSGMEEVERLARVRYVQPAELPDAIGDADALFMWAFQSTALADAWPRAHRLQWVHTASAGVDRVLIPEVAKSDVVVTNSRGVFDDAIAEYVLGLVLLFAKGMHDTLARQRTRTWEHRDTEMVAGRSALVVGVGPIGRAVGRLLAAAGMHVSGVGRTARSEDPDFGTVLGSADLADALPAADYVVAVAPLTEETRGMFDAAAFARMRSTARFINVGRGPLVVERDLIAALREERIAGAGLDVFEEEPLSYDSPLWSMSNVVVSPHMSADYVGWLDTLARVFVDNFHRWHGGEELRNVVDKWLGYVPSAP
ncbi:MAG: D-2-hydroxyacid dehydrogenase [Streptosporangiales bacterium]